METILKHQSLVQLHYLAMVALEKGYSTCMGRAVGEPLKKCSNDLN